LTVSLYQYKFDVNLGIDYPVAKFKYILRKQIYKKMKPKLSTIVCTYTRTHRLIECLKTIEKQTLSRDMFEVVIVTRLLSPEHENNLKEFLKQTSLNTTIVPLAPECSGCSKARNAGLAKAKGEIIHYLDDDTLTTPDCLKAYVDIFDSTDAMGAGGRIIPKFISRSPAWMQPALWSLLGVLDLGNKVREFTYPSNFPVGANMAFRREVFDRYGIFDENLGPLGHIGIDADETDVCYKIQNDGGKLLYCPDALIYHCIEGDKMNWRWMIKRSYGTGKGSAIIQLKHIPASEVFAVALKSLIRKGEQQHFVAEHPRSSLYSRAYYVQTRLALMLGYGIEVFRALCGVPTR
jgi:glucosyl-dolichyl phosphate glucuronosyltransferase